MLGNSCALVALISLAFASGAFAQAKVDLEIAVDSGLSVTTMQELAREFEDAGLRGVRMRQATGREAPAVEESGEGALKRYRVTAIYGRDGFRVPNERFALRSAAALKSWAGRLGMQGPKELAAPKVAFGMSAEGLVALHAKLKVLAPDPTKGKRSGDVARTIVKTVGLAFEVTPRAQEAFRASKEPIGDELQGIACGTALAAALRPAGLVYYPSPRAGGETTLVIAASDEAGESWPIGWPLEGSTLVAAPNLLKYLEVEIEDVTLFEASDAIRSRVEMPFLWDYNGMAGSGIDPAAIKVSLPAKRLSYKRILDALLFQAKLVCEIRMDEAEQAFLWIQPFGLKSSGAAIDADR